MSNALLGGGLLAIVALVLSFLKGRGAVALLANQKTKEDDLALKATQAENNAAIKSEEEKRAEIQANADSEIKKEMTNEELQEFFNRTLKPK